jgi:uncharacterized membrane protein YvlD (DUF360 family)
MRYPDFARVPLAILTAGLVVGAICQLPAATLLYVLDGVGGLIWFAILMYVAAALLKPAVELWETHYDRSGCRNP